MAFDVRAIAKDRVGSFLENTYNPTETVFKGMEAQGIEDRAFTLNDAKRDAIETTTDATIEGYKGLQSAAQSQQRGQTGSAIGKTLFGIGKMALSGPTGGLSNLIPNPF